MTLPTISIPKIELPFEIPAFLGDYLVHFIVVLPVIILLLELYNLGTKRRSISVFSLFLVIFLTLFIIAFYLMGSSTGDEHKLLTIYFVYASLGLLLFKLLFMALRKIVGKILFILIVGGFTAVTLLQVSTGGLLASKDVSTPAPNSKVEDELNGKIKELQEKYDALVEKNKVVETPVGKIEVVEAIAVSENNISN